MHKSVCKNDVKIIKNDFEMDAKITQKASKRRPRGVQGDPSRPGDVQKASKWRPRGAKLDLLVFYGVFKRPQSSGGMRARALITYRLGRLTEQ